MTRAPVCQESGVQRRRSNALSPAPATPVTGRALIPLDTRQIRKQALLAYRKAERSFAKVTDLLKRYRERDLPGFSVWCQHTFGEQFAQLRRLQADLRAKQTLAREISDLAFRLGLSEVDAYLEYLWRRDNPEAAAEDDRRREEDARREAEQAQKKKKKKRDAEPDALDLDDLFADNLDEEKRDEMEDLFASFLGARRAHPSKTPEVDFKTARELYRTIVRKLHPDHHGRMSEAKKHLWDEAQSAWRSLDVKTLKNVLDQCENAEIGVGENTAVSTLLHLTRRLKDALRQARAQVRQLSRKLEWDYEARKTNPAYARKVKQLILDDLRLLHFQYDRLTRAFQSLEQHAARKTRKRPAPRARPPL